MCVHLAFTQADRHRPPRVTCWPEQTRCPLSGTRHGRDCPSFPAVAAWRGERFPTVTCKCVTRSPSLSMCRPTCGPGTAVTAQLLRRVISNQGTVHVVQCWCVQGPTFPHFCVSIRRHPLRKPVLRVVPCRAGQA